MKITVIFYVHILVSGRLTIGMPDNFNQVGGNIKEAALSEITSGVDLKAAGKFTIN
ncbi:MAG: hypothetical protein AB2L20_02875 [Mangrovibacterium sp.]